MEISTEVSHKESCIIVRIRDFFLNNNPLPTPGVITDGVLFSEWVCLDRGCFILKKKITFTEYLFYGECIGE